MTKEEFCKAYTEIYGEPLDNLEQLAEQTFTGQELFEFVNDIIQQQCVFKTKKYLGKQKFIKPSFIKAGDTSVLLGVFKQPSRVDCRVIAEKQYQLLYDVYINCLKTV